MNAAALWIEVAGRWAVYLAALPWIGVVAARLLVWTRVAVLAPSERHEIVRALGRWALLLAFGLLFAVALRAWGQTAVTFGIADAFDLDHLRTVAVESRWGTRFRWQVATAVAALAAALCIHLRVPGGWALAAIAAIAACLALPRTGHAAAHGALALIAQTLHVLGAGLWVGTLAAVLWGKRWRTVEGTPWHEVERAGRIFTAEALRVFAPLAIAGAGTLTASGALTAYLYLPDLASLFTTSWGRALCVKTTLVAVVGLLGLRNFRRFRRGGTDVPSLRLAQLEVLVALVVVLLTGLLTALPSPDG